MNPNALWALWKLAEKPSNKKIRLTRIIFAIALILVIVFGLYATDVNFSIFDYKIAEIPYDEYIVPILFIFPIIGLIRGIFDPGWFHKSVWKKIIITCGLVMIVLSVFFLSEKPYQTATVVNQNIVTPIGPDAIANTQNDPKAIFATVSTDNWIFFFGLITLFVGFFLNNKNLTTKNEKHAEVIKKIRV